MTSPNDNPPSDLNTAIIRYQKDFEKQAKEIESLKEELKITQIAARNWIKQIQEVQGIACRYKAALVEIANTDYRGNRSSEMTIAYRALQSATPPKSGPQKE